MERIYIWADGTWCYEEELEQMTHMSDDHALVTLLDDEEPEDAVARYFKR